MPRGKRKSVSEQMETLNKIVDVNSGSEDPAVRALKDIPNASNMEALDIAAALQEIIRGQKIQGEELAKARQEMARMDKAAKEWQEDRQKFIEDVDAMADKIRLVGDELEKLQAKAASDVQHLTEAARAEQITDRMRLEEAWSHEPKETITSPGIPKIVREGANQMARVFPEILIIKHKTWVFPPYVPVDVPKSVADELRHRRRVQAETAERRKALSPDPQSGRLMESGMLEQEMIRIDKKYDTSTERLNK